jgi:phosphopantothenate---cysteine ligase (CTP)
LIVLGAAMNILVTSGNTQVPIDRVRVISNVFSGRTGAVIALHAQERGHTVTLLTSHPDVVATLLPDASTLAERWTIRRYQTFDELHDSMRDLLGTGSFDVLIHSAAVSDYVSAGVFAPAPGTSFAAEADGGAWVGAEPRLIDRTAGKVKSDEPELWIRLTRAPKLVDLVRFEWGFRGLLVKFKLEVGVSDVRLLEIAERSRTHSAADLMVANTLEGSAICAFIGPRNGQYERVDRSVLASKLLDAIEAHLRSSACGLAGDCR